MPVDVPVAIVGGGPAGLTAAIELARRGVPCRVFERKVAPLMTSNALVVQPRTLEIWAEQSTLEEALARGIAIRAMNMYVGRKQLAHVSFGGLETETDYAFQLALPQSESEHVLSSRLSQLGVQVERGKEVVDLKEHGSAKCITVRHEDGEETVNAGWVVGCDGGRSIVRQKLGLQFLGSDLDERFIMADLPLKWPYPADESHVFLSARGACGVISLREYSRIIFEVTHEEELAGERNPAMKDFERLAKERCPVPVEFGPPLWISSLWTHQKISSAFRVGRVFLSGDAAHVHSPVGGQGMNTGIQDSYNLGWKLALVIQGCAHDSLLDTYEAERRPVAQRVLRQTTLMTRLIGVTNPLSQSLRNALFSFLFATEKGARRQSRNVTNLAVAYHDSSLNNGQRSIRKDLRVGDRAPFASRFVTDRFALVLVPGRTEMIDDALLESLALDETWRRLLEVFVIRGGPGPPVNDTVRIIEDTDGKLTERFASVNPTAYVLRPDKYISFCSSPPDPQQLHSYLGTSLSPTIEEHT